MVAFDMSQFANRSRELIDDPTRRYRRPDEVIGTDGRSMAAVSPGGRNGIVIPSAVAGGNTSSGYDHNVPGKVVVDPTMAGSYEIDNSLVTGPMVLQARAMALTALGLTPKSTLSKKQKRDATSATIYALGHLIQQTGECTVKFATTPPTQDSFEPDLPQASVAAYMPPPAPAHVPTGRVLDNPMAFFSSPVSPVTKAAPAPRGEPVMRMVTFGTQMGKTVAPFSSVLVELAPNKDGGFIVLGVPTAYRGAIFTPNASEEPIALLIEGDPYAYKAEVIGMEFEHKGERLSIYTIQEAKLIQ